MTTSATPATPTTATRPAIIITDQRFSLTPSTAAYRVELYGQHGSGVGYGATPQSAYSEARHAYRESQLAALKEALKTLDAEFVAQTLSATAGAALAE